MADSADLERPFIGVMDFKCSGQDSALNRKPEKYFVCGESLLQDKRFTALPIPARYTYICLLSAAGHKFGEWTFSDSDFSAYGLNRVTAYRHLKVLTERGFIECTGKKGSTYQYRFSERWRGDDIQARRRAEFEAAYKQMQTTGKSGEFHKGLLPNLLSNYLDKGTNSNNDN